MYARIIGSLFLLASICAFADDSCTMTVSDTDHSLRTMSKSLLDTSIQWVKNNKTQPKQKKLEELKNLATNLISTKDVTTPNQADLEFLLQKLQNAEDSTLLFHEEAILSKTFDNRDHSVERILETFHAQKAGSNDQILQVLCTRTFNCMNARDQHQWCNILAKPWL